MGELEFRTQGGQRFPDLDATIQNIGEGGQLDLHLNLQHAFGYGDNPHQRGYFFDIAGVENPLGMQHFVQVEGRTPSKSNYHDLTRGRRVLTRTAANFDVNTGNVPLLAVAMKHGNPSGA